jgi:hypothetical protein
MSSDFKKCVIYKRVQLIHKRARITKQQPDLRIRLQNLKDNLKEAREADLIKKINRRMDVNDRIYTSRSLLPPPYHRFDVDEHFYMLHMMRRTSRNLNWEPDNWFFHRSLVWDEEIPGPNVNEHLEWIPDEPQIVLNLRYVETVY